MSRLFLALSLLVQGCASQETACAFWCRFHPKTWATKCAWTACDGCSVCGPNKGCKPWCTKHSTPWKSKCGWEACDGCDVCGPSTCKPWCETSNSPWDVKCGWEACDGCSACPEAELTPPPSPSVSPPASEETTPLPAWYTSDEECTGSSVPPTFTCTRSTYDPYFRTDQSRTSSYPGGQGPLHWPPGTFISSLVEEVDQTTGTRTAIMSEDAWFGPRVSEKLIGEVVAADPIYCAESHETYTHGSPHSGVDYIKNKEELAGKIVLCQRHPKSDPVHYSELALFVSYNVPTAKAVLVMNNIDNGEKDGYGIKGMMDGYDVCSGNGDMWGDKLRSELLYDNGCTLPLIAITEDSGNALIGKTVAITPADQVMKEEITVSIEDPRYAEFNGKYVPLPKRCAKPQFGEESLHPHYAGRTPSNYNYCWHSTDSEGCVDFPSDKAPGDCVIATCDLASTRMKYVLESDLHTGAEEMHYLTYLFKYGGTQVPSFTTIGKYTDNSANGEWETWGSYNGWILGKWTSDALRSSRCGVLWDKPQYGAGEEYPEEAHVQWGYLYQEDKFGAASKYPTTAPWEPLIQWLKTDKDCLNYPTPPNQKPCGPSGPMMGGDGDFLVDVTLEPPAQQWPLPQFPTSVREEEAFTGYRRELRGGEEAEEMLGNAPGNS